MKEKIGTYTFKKAKLFTGTLVIKLHFVLNNLVLTTFCYPEPGARAGADCRTGLRFDRLHNTADIQRNFSGLGLRIRLDRYRIY